MKRFFVPVSDGSNDPKRIEESMYILGCVLRNIGTSPMPWEFKNTPGYLIEADRIVGIPGVEVRGSEEWR